MRIHGRLRRDGADMDALGVIWLDQNPHMRVPQGRARLRACSSRSRPRAPGYFS